MEWRLHRGGRWRSWLGARLGGDAELGDRIWRRCLHLLGLAVLLYYLLPVRLTAWLTTEQLLLTGLAVVLALEVARHSVGLQLPTIRAHEEHRIASYTWFAVGLVVAVLFFPLVVAAVVVLGTAIVDPLIGELRISARGRRFYPAVPAVVYAGMALAVFVGVGHWHAVPALGAAAGLAVLALAVESPKRPWLDDDITMTVVPGAVAVVVLWLAPALPGWGP